MVALQEASGRQISKLTLRVGLVDEQGGAQSRVLELRRDDVASR